jgi:hypothetical protein
MAAAVGEQRAHAVCVGQCSLPRQALSQSSQRRQVPVPPAQQLHHALGRAHDAAPIVSAGVLNAASSCGVEAAAPLRAGVLDPTAAGCFGSDLGFPRRIPERPPLHPVRPHWRSPPPLRANHRADACDTALAAQSVHQRAGEPLASVTPSAGNRKLASEPGHDDYLEADQLRFAPRALGAHKGTHRMAGDYSQAQLRHRIVLVGRLKPLTRSVAAAGRDASARSRWLL